MSLWTTYYASLAVLTTTNEHMTAWRVHEDLVWALFRSEGRLFLDSEARYMMALGTSNLARVNKSLVLWCWIRKLFVAGAFNGGESAKHIDKLMEQVLQAMQAHFQNYAAGFTAAWILQVSGSSSAVLNMIRARCMENITDVSLWTLLGTLLVGKESEEVAQDYSRVLSELKIRGLGSFQEAAAGNSVSLVDRCSIANDLLKWLLAVEAPHENPYNQLLRHRQPPSFQCECIQKIKSDVNEGFKKTLIKLIERWYPAETDQSIRIRKEK